MAGGPVPWFPGRAVQHRNRPEAADRKGGHRHPPRPARHGRPDLPGPVRRAHDARAAVPRRTRRRERRRARRRLRQGGTRRGGGAGRGPYGRAARPRRDPEDPEPRVIPHRDHSRRHAHRARHRGGGGVARAGGVPRRARHLGVRLRPPSHGGAVALPRHLHLALLRGGRDAGPARRRAPAPRAHLRRRGGAPVRQDPHRRCRPGAAGLLGAGGAAGGAGRVANRRVLVRPRQGGPGRGPAPRSPVPELPRGRGVHDDPDAVPAPRRAGPARPPGPRHPPRPRAPGTIWRRRCGRFACPT